METDGREDEWNRGGAGLCDRDYNLGEMDRTP